MDLGRETLKLGFNSGDGCPQLDNFSVGCLSKSVGVLKVPSQFPLSTFMITEIQGMINVS